MLILEGATAFSAEWQNCSCGQTVLQGEVLRAGESPWSHAAWWWVKAALKCLLQSCWHRFSCTFFSLCSHFADLLLKPPQPPGTRFVAIRVLLCASWTFPPSIAVFLNISFRKHWHLGASQPWVILRQNHHCHNNGDGELAQVCLPAHCNKCH